jgi:ABC-type cobalamin/Fe3+-siderophores transport system ATPase subunit
MGITRQHWPVRISFCPRRANDGRCKTTLLRSLSKSLTGDCAFMPQHHRDSFALPVKDWVMLHAENLNCAEGLAQIVKDLDVAHLLDRRITELSGGERQRVGLAAVAIQRKKIWLLDEPISAQDPAHQALIGRWLAAQNGAAIAFAAHDVAWVGRYATHVLAFLEQRGVEQGTTQSMLTSQKLKTIFGCTMSAPDLTEPLA